MLKQKLSNLLGNKLTLLIVLFLLALNSNFANNISVTNATVTGQNTTSHYTMVQFDISWDNSFRDAVNYDAAWVFAKYKKDGVWHHCTLNTSGHTAPSGSAIDTPTDGMGAFIYRSANGSGTFSLTSAQLRWNYGVDGLADGDNVTVKVFAIEMVDVPQGAFSVGTGGSEYDLFYKYPTTSNPYTISSEAEITVGTATDNLYYANLSGNGGDQAGPIPVAFPKGYNAFYCMKYETTQEQYVDFLNMLTREQQNSRTATSLADGTTSVTNRYVMQNSTTVSDRNGIRCDATIPTSDPITFYCDLDVDGTGNESEDGQNIACNYLLWSDDFAYADWAGLRPMTELEYEKACRGNQTPVAGEFAWGTADIASSFYTLSNSGLSNEGINTNYSTSTGNSAVTNTTGVTGIDGPLRVGIFAANTSNSGRVTSGATYYGVMEMTGNVTELCITVGSTEGRTYTGLEGDGVLTTDGFANTSYWGTNTHSTGQRGGNFIHVVTNATKVSDRADANAHPSTYSRNREIGFRAVRTAQ